MQLTHPEPFAARWRGKWIWHGRPEITNATATRPVLADPRDKVVLLRRSVDLASVPESAPARIWVDGRYVLTVNGTEVARGPVRSDPRCAHYDVMDLAPHLHVGTNVIAVTARHFGEATSWWMPVPPSYSLGAGSMVFEAQIDGEWIVSDRQWRAAEGAAWTPVSMPGDVASLPLESFDARHHPHGWQAREFDDGEWNRAFEIMPMHTGAHGEGHPPSEPFGMLRPPVRRAFADGVIHRAELGGSIRVTGAETVDDPVRQVLADEQSAGDVATGIGAGVGAGVEMRRFDTGRIVAGTVRLEISGAAAGTVVDLAAAEHCAEDGRLVTLGQHAGLRYVCAGGDEQFESLDIIGAQYFHVSVRVPNGGATPTISLSVQDRHRPRPPGASFECSDPALNTIHAIGLRTVDLCALDAYVDCPTREQRAWTGDSVVHQMVDLTNNPDWSMAIWHPQLATHTRADGMLAMAAASDFALDDRTFVPDWALHWVRSVHNIHMYAGEPAVVAEMLPIAERMLRWFESYLDENGLLVDVTGWRLPDWASVYVNGCTSTLNALWARALEDFAEMSEWFGNGGSAAWARAHHARIREGFEVFWDESRSVYVDHLVDGVPRPAASQLGGALALAAGLVPEDRLDRVVAVLTDRSRQVQSSFVMDPVRVGGDMSGYAYMVLGYPEPHWDAHEQMVWSEPFFRYVLHDGLARAGRADLVADLCRDWQVFVDAGETTWPECWVGGTRCHGWSSTPSRDLIVHTLGIAPASPGFTSVRIRPALGDLEWARATVPTPFGPLSVEAHADGRLSIDSPIPVVEE